MIQLARKVLFAMAMVVVLFGMLPNAALAQDTPADTGNGSSTDSTTAEDLWHQRPTGLTATEKTPETMEGPLDVYVELKYAYDAYKNLKAINGDKGHHSRQTYTANGHVELLMNPEAAAAGANSYRIGIRSWFEKANGHYPNNIDLLAYTQTGGQITLRVGSSDYHNGRLYYDVMYGVGAVYKEHGDISAAQLSTSLHADIGYRVGLNWGPVMGFKGDLQLGEHSSAWFDGELSAGVRIVAEDIALDVRGLLVARDRDSNTTTGNFTKVEQETLHTGIQVGVVLWERLSASFRHTWGRDRFKVDVPAGGDSDDTYGQSFELSIGLYF
jgi:hypothetical protein